MLGSAPGAVNARVAPTHADAPINGADSACVNAEIGVDAPQNRLAAA
jgi:hypothetical protein